MDMRQFQKAEAEYYSDAARERMMGGVHDEDDPRCGCSDCEQAAEDAAAELAFEIWRERQYEDEQTEPDDY